MNNEEEVKKEETVEEEEYTEEDDLSESEIKYREEQEKKKKKRPLFIAIFIAILLIGSGLSYVLFTKLDEAKKGNGKQWENPTEDDQVVNYDKSFTKDKALELLKEKYTDLAYKYEDDMGDFYTFSIEKDDRTCYYYIYKTDKSIKENCLLPDDEVLPEGAIMPE